MTEAPLSWKDSCKYLWINCLVGQLAVSRSQGKRPVASMLKVVNNCREHSDWFMDSNAPDLQVSVEFCKTLKWL